MLTSSQDHRHVGFGARDIATDFLVPINWPSLGYSPKNGSIDLLLVFGSFPFLLTCVHSSLCTLFRLYTTLLRDIPFFEMRTPRKKFVTKCGGHYRGSTVRGVCAVCSDVG